MREFPQSKLLFMAVLFKWLRPDVTGIFITQEYHPCKKKNNNNNDGNCDVNIWFLKSCIFIPSSSNRSETLRLPRPLNSVTVAYFTAYIFLKIKSSRLAGINRPKETLIRSKAQFKKKKSSREEFLSSLSELLLWISFSPSSFNKYNSHVVENQPSAFKMKRRLLGLISTLNYTHEVSIWQDERGVEVAEEAQGRCDATPPNHHHHHNHPARARS